MLSVAASESLAMFRPVDERDPTRYEVGPETLRWVPFTAVTMLPQQRTTMNQDGLDQLKSAMTVTDDNGRQEIKLLHPPTLNIFGSRTSAQRYVEALNDCWDLEHPKRAIKPYTEGGEFRVYPALIAGHRRLTGIGQILPDLGHEEAETDVLFSVHEGLDFNAALDLQYRENEHQRLTPWQDARAIATRYKSGLIKGEFTTFKSCADAMGVTSERVSQAWRFFQLPSFVQEAVKDSSVTRLHYGKAVMLYDIAKAVAGTMEFRNRYDRNMATDMAEYLKEQIADMSLLELTEHFDDDETRHYEYQVSIHKNAVAHISKADATVYVKANVADLEHQRDRGEAMSATDYAAITRAKQLTKLATTRRDTYHVTSLLLNDLELDAVTLARINADPDSLAVEQLVHSPSARRVIQRFIGLLVDIDGAIPDEEFVRELSARKNALIIDLMTLGGENMLPDQIHHAVASHMPSPVSDGEVSLFEEMAS